jgi:hypothetical protein
MGLNSLNNTDCAHFLVLQHIRAEIMCSENIGNYTYMSRILLEKILVT